MHFVFHYLEPGSSVVTPGTPSQPLACFLISRSFQCYNSYLSCQIRRIVFLRISQFGDSDYDALWDGVTGDIMHKPD